MTDLLKFKETCDKAYDIGIPLISDEQYDNLFGESATVGRVGYRDDIKHVFPMYSLQKHYDEDGEPPLPLHLCVKTPKLDGAAVNLLYVAGKFSRASTRGDGTKGKDVTEKLRLLVPANIDSCFPVLQIVGEVVGDKTIENSRNQVSGALNVKELSSFKEKMHLLGINFVAYSVSNTLNCFYRHDLEDMESQGFSTVIGKCSNFPTDGTVYRLNHNAEFVRSGFTAKHPRGAFAWKAKQKPVVTTLLGIDWQVGKSGKVTPVALLDPVMIGDASVSRATLNNMAFIENLGLEINCQVEVIRAGEIIPEIVGRYYLTTG